MSKQKEENKTVSKVLLESYRSALYRVQEYFDSIDPNDPQYDIDTRMKLLKSILDAGGALGKNIETLATLEIKVEKENIEEVKRRGDKKTSRFEND